MSTYHINETTSRVNLCKAKSPETCPLKNDDGTVSPHFDNKEDAKNHMEKTLSKNYDLTSTIVKPNNARKTTKKKTSRVFGINEEENLKLTASMIAEYKAILEHDEHHRIEIALENYSFVGSSEMNKMLHGITEYHGRKIDVQKNMERVKVLDSIIRENGMNGTRRKLYRYLALDKNINLDEYIDQHFGDGEYHDAGFMSTTQDVSMVAGYARKFSKNRQFLLLEIETDKGISMQKGEERVGDLLTFEKERLLPRNMKFSVDGQEKQSIKVDPSRRKLLAEFSGFGYNESNAPESMTAKSFQVIKLTDKNMIN